MSQSVTVKNPKKTFSTKDITLTAMFTALMVVCSWITVPAGTIVFTLQIFAIFCALELLGGKNTMLAILTHILLGAVGLPVFSGFKGGIGVLLGPTGGYISGFVIMAAVYWAGTSLLGSRLPVRISLMLLGLILCYTFGTIWFVYGYSKGGSAMTFRRATEICVIPFVPFDLLKLALALLISGRIKKLTDKI